jgi:hypothetical protein
LTAGPVLLGKAAWPEAGVRDEPGAGSSTAPSVQVMAAFAGPLSPAPVNVKRGLRVGAGGCR